MRWVQRYVEVMLFCGHDKFKPLLQDLERCALCQGLACLGFEYVVGGGSLAVRAPSACQNRQRSMVAGGTNTDNVKPALKVFGNKQVPSFLTAERRIEAWCTSEVDVTISPIVWKAVCVKLVPVPHAPSPRHFCPISISSAQDINVANSGAAGHSLRWTAWKHLPLPPVSMQRQSLRT